MEERNKLPPHNRKKYKKIAVTAGISGILFLSECTGSRQYDVLDRVADMTTTGENTAERIKDYIEANTSDEKAVLSQIVSKMTDSDNNDDEEIGVNSRPEYDPLQYVDVTNADISKVPLNAEDIVTDEDAEEFIHNEMRNKKVFSDAVSAAKGDIVNIDYTATESGTTEPEIDVKDEDRTIGNNLFPDEIDQKLLGVQAGDVIDVEYTYPDNDSDALRRGKTYTFHITVNQVKGMTITDDVATHLSNKAEKTADEYKAYIKYLLEYKAMENLSVSGVDKLCDMCTVNSYPEDVVNYDIQYEFIKLYQEFDIEGSDKESLLKKIQSLGYTSIEDFTKEIKTNVTENLKKEMEVLALAKKYNLWLDDEELDTEIVNQTVGCTNAEDYYEEYSKYHAQYVIAKMNLAKEIQSANGSVQNPETNQESEAKK